jgi:phage shock protein PspC (stress-responsive transcriptional regulator)
LREGINRAPANACLSDRRLLIVGVRSQQFRKRGTTWAGGMTGRRGLECSRGPRRTHYQLVGIQLVGIQLVGIQLVGIQLIGIQLDGTVGWSEAARPSCHVRLNVVGLVNKRSPGEVHRHSLSAIARCCAPVVMCRLSTLGLNTVYRLNTRRLASRHISQGSHVLGPEDHPDRASNRSPACELMLQSRSNQKAFTVQEGQLDMTLYRPHDDRIIAGVCSGIARRFNLDPTIVRILFVASLFLPGPQILIYLVAWLLMPDESSIVA